MSDKPVSIRTVNHIEENDGNSIRRIAENIRCERYNMKSFVKSTFLSMFNIQD